ncbi:hypothetical protein LWI29_004673 [Acer saccharum]|uniref:Uncharacterized protein n=1 Tax=Acer saccharum TaxID=4024 RepID=A0AA39S5Y9_ACESA|nr:hypothetical protein LWI29_004673 [Acer saccharum]
MDWTVAFGMVQNLGNQSEFVEKTSSETRYNGVSDVSSSEPGWRLSGSDLGTGRISGSDRTTGSDFGSDLGSDFGSDVGSDPAIRARKTTGAWWRRAGGPAARGRRVESLSNFRRRVRPLCGSDLGEIFTGALLSTSRTLWCTQNSILSTLISGQIWFCPLFFEFLALLGSDTTVGGMAIVEVTCGAPLWKMGDGSWGVDRGDRWQQGVNNGGFWNFGGKLLEAG